MIKCLKLLKVKTEHNISEAAFKEILEIMKIPLSLFKIKKKLEEMVRIQPLRVDMCTKSCCAFTGNFSHLSKCPICDEPRYLISEASEKPRKFAYFFSLADRLKIQYENKERAEELMYRHDYCSNAKSMKNGNFIEDIYDGARYQHLVEKSFFMDSRDIGLSASCDGYQIFRQKRDDCWIIMFINNNLSPSARVKKDNLMIAMIISGPSEPKDLNSFLLPLVEELKQLEGNIILDVYNLHKSNIKPKFSAGISCIDGRTKTIFSLHAHIITWSGDIPALTKILHLTGHGSYCGCRFCEIQGIHHSGMYFPLQPPLDTMEEMRDKVYEVGQLPKRTMQKTLYQLEKIKNGQKDFIKKFGKIYNKNKSQGLAFLLCSQSNNVFISIYRHKT